jgi:hypothetical protein
MGFCYNCGETLNNELDFSRSDRCPKCGRDTRVCKNCEFYDVTKYNECSETNADRITDKEKSNFCDYFKPASQNKNQNQTLSAAEKAKLQLEALFKKK